MDGRMEAKTTNGNGTAAYDMDGMDGIDRHRLQTHCTWDSKVLIVFLHKAVCPTLAVVMKNL
jgi:hypothetical protein